MTCLRKRRLPPLPVGALEIGVAVELVAQAPCVLGLKGSRLDPQRAV